MIFGGIEKKIVSLPKSWFYGKLLMDGACHLQFVVSHKNNIFAAESYVVGRKNYLPDISSFFNFNLAKHFIALQIVHQNSCGSRHNELKLASTAEQPQNLHFVRQSQNLFFVVSWYFLEMNLVRRCKDGDLCTGNEATVKSIVLSGDIRKIEVGLFLFDHESFVIIFMSFHHK